MARCCKYKAGDLNAQIAIERATNMADGAGGFTTSWASETVWAQVRPLGGNERWNAERVAPGNRYRVIIRFRGDSNGAPYYTISDRVVYKGRVWGITSVVDVDDQQRFLELMCMENRPS